MINDKAIKSLISHYQKGTQNFPKIAEMLGEFIYHFPAFGFDVHHEDIKGDFYLYISERLPKIIEQYQPSNRAQFKTFFYLVLRRHYLNFITGSPRLLPSEPLSHEDQYYSDDCLLDKEIKLEKITLLFASLPQRYRLILKLRCPEFLLPEDIFALSREFSHPPHVLLSRLPQLFSHPTAPDPASKGPIKTTAPTSPRVIASFLDIKANQVSKWLVEIKKLLQPLKGELYVS